MLGICGKTQARYIGRIGLEMQRMDRSCTRHRRRWTRRRYRDGGRYQRRSILSSSCSTIDIRFREFIGKKYRCSYCKRIEFKCSFDWSHLNRGKMNEQVSASLPTRYALQKSGGFLVVDQSGHATWRTSCFFACRTYTVPRFFS